MKKIFIAFAIIMSLPFMIVAGLLLAGPSIIEPAYEKAAAESSFMQQSCNKVWAHRGLVTDGIGNTIASVEHAFASGAQGVEVDILYDASDRLFYVSHDRPYQTTTGEKLTLDQLLTATAHQGMFWLDAKDLKKLSFSAAKDATQQLAATIKKHGMQSRAFVESNHPIYLSWLQKRGIQTSLMVSINERKYPRLVYLGSIYMAKAAFTLGSFNAISMSYPRYTENTAKDLGPDVAILLSTVNDSEEIQNLANKKSVAIILSDNNLFHINSCSTNMDKQTALPEEQPLAK